MLDELFDKDYDDRELASLIDIYPRIARLVEEYNRYAARDGNLDLIRYTDKVSVFKAALRAIPVDERIHALAHYVDTKEKSMEKIKLHSQEALRHRIINAVVLMALLVLLAWLSLMVHSHVTGKPIPDDGVLGQIFNLFTEISKLVLGFGRLSE